MRTLFLMILSGVFLLCNLFFPNAFEMEGNNLLEEISTEIPLIPTATVEIISRIESTQIPDEESAVKPEESVQIPEVSDTASVEAQVTDLISLFGDAKITDNFERGSSGFGINAGLNDDDAIRIIALNNHISLEPKKSNGWLSWRLRPPAIGDGAAEMEFSITTCARGDRTGLIMHAPDYTGGQGYYFSLACEGTISILRDSTVLGTADAGELFRNSSGAVNVLGALIRGNTLTAILNGQEALSVQDNTYTQGFSGFFTAPQNQDTLSMDITTFRIYYQQ